MTILNVKDISYSYKDGKNKRVILDNINYDFELGKFYTILGQSGSGKTTFVSLVAALDQPTEGVVSYNGTDLNEIGLINYRKHHVGMIFQDFNLIPYMSAVQNVTTAMAISGVKEDKQRAFEILEEVGINREVASRKVTTLSGGEKQRVAITRALVGDKNIIIGDEPTGNLDATISDSIVDIFIKLAHEHNKCVIVVTHSQELADRSDIQLHLDSYTHQFVEKESKP